MQSDLLTRLEAASGGDRELDALVVARQNNALLKPYPPATDFGPSAKWQFWSLDGKHFLGNESKFPVPPLTASMDAVRALARKHGFYINSEPRFHIDGERVDFVSYALRPRWSDWGPDDEWFDRGEGRHADQVISACIALLKALEASAPQTNRTGE